MAYKNVHKVVRKKEDSESKGRQKASDRRWLLVDNAFERRTGQSESMTRLSHDIRTQLYIIIGFAELMLEEIPGKINEEQRHNLNDVLNSGKRLQTLLDNIVGQPESRADSAKNGQPSRRVK